MKKIIGFTIAILSMGVAFSLVVANHSEESVVAPSAEVIAEQMARAHQNVPPVQMSFTMTEVTQAIDLLRAYIDIENSEKSLEADLKNCFKGLPKDQAIFLMQPLKAMVDELISKQAPGDAQEPAYQKLSKAQISALLPTFCQSELVELIYQNAPLNVE